MNTRIRFVLLAALTIGVLLPGCERNADPAMVASLDSMLVHVDSLKLATNGIDVGLVRRVDSTFKQQQGSLEAVMQDTLDRAWAVFVGNYYRAMSKSLPRVMAQYDQVRNELDTSRAKISALRHDVDRGLLSDEPKRGYHQQEKLVLKELHRSTDVLLSSYGTVTRAYAEAYRVDSLIQAHATSAP